MIDFKDLSYLKTGNLIQQECFSILNDLKIFQILQDFQPILCGTIPIEINIPSSDLDIICCVQDRNQFLNKCEEFSMHESFSIVHKEIKGHVSIICRFTYKNVQLEIFGQNRPSDQQDAYLHMIKEYQILQLKDDAFKHMIIQLKINGLSTEEAFATLLEIKGDPYIELLNFTL